MREDEIKKSLNSAMDDLVKDIKPPDITIVRKRKTYLIAFPTVAVACVLILFLFLPREDVVKSYIYIDVNPSVELELENQRVIKINAINDDANVIVQQVRAGGTWQSTVTRIVNELISAGYFNTEERKIYLSYTENKQVNDASLKDVVDSCLLQKQKKANVICRRVQDSAAYYEIKSTDEKEVPHKRDEAPKTPKPTKKPRPTPKRTPKPKVTSKPTSTPSPTPKPTIKDEETKEDKPVKTDNPNKANGKENAPGQLKKDTTKGNSSNKNKNKKSK